MDVRGGASRASMDAPGRRSENGVGLILERKRRGKGRKKEGENGEEGKKRKKRIGKRKKEEKKPLVVETFGGWDKDAAKYLKEIARLDARRWAKNDAIEIKHFFERLSVALQRGNAALLINRDADVNCI